MLTLIRIAMMTQMIPRNRRIDNSFYQHKGNLFHVSAAPVVLIDEPENAGIDKHAVLDLLSGSGKIVLISTHEPVLALSCQKRIVLKNGAVSQFLTRSPQEEAILHEMRNIDRRLQSVRDVLRMGEQL